MFSTTAIQTYRPNNQILNKFGSFVERKAINLVLKFANGYQKSKTSKFDQTLHGHLLPYQEDRASTTKFLQSLEPKPIQSEENTSMIPAQKNTSPITLKNMVNAARTEYNKSSKKTSFPAWVILKGATMSYRQLLQKLHKMYPNSKIPLEVFKALSATVDPGCSA